MNDLLINDFKENKFCIKFKNIEKFKKWAKAVDGMFLWVEGQKPSRYIPRYTGIFYIYAYTRKLKCDSDPHTEMIIDSDKFLELLYTNKYYKKYLKAPMRMFLYG